MAWYAPAHRVLHRAAPFFAERFASFMREHGNSFTAEDAEGPKVALPIR